MKENKHTGEKNTENRKELAERYFGYDESDKNSVVVQAYAEGNLGIVSLLSDLQHHIEYGFTEQEVEYWRVLLNDVKLVLINDTRKEKEERNKT